MRLVNTRSLSSSEILARSIYNESGVALIQRGMSLTERMINRLINFGITYVYIEDEFTNDIQVDTVISEELRMEATSVIKKSFSNVENNEILKKSYVLNTSSNDIFAIVSQILRNIIRKEE